MSKPTAKPAAAPAKGEEAVATPPKSKKKMIIGVALLLLAVAGGAGWFFTKGHAPAADGHAEDAKAEPHHEPKFIPLGENFTVNLQHEADERYLQAGITLKVMQPELEEKIKAAMPEIRSKLLFLLSSKKPSELQTAEGKKILVAEIIAETDGVLGIGAAPAHAAAPVAAAASAVVPAAHEGATAAHEGEAHAASAVAAAPAAPAVHKTTGVVDVLFTSFIIQ